MVRVAPNLRLDRSSPPPSSLTGNPKWLSGVISGAGRLLSSMFRLDDDELQCSYASDTDGGDSVTSDEDENADASSEEFHELDVSEGSSKSCIRHEDRHEDGQQLLTQKSERNIAIEQLLLQETFSRDECDGLIKIIQSRVVDTLDVGKEAGVKEQPENIDCSVMAFSRTSRPLNPGRRSPAGLTCAVNHLNDLSPRSIVSGNCSPELYEEATIERKKSLEKTLTSISESELNCGPCSLNTDVLHYDLEPPTKAVVNNLLHSDELASSEPWPVIHNDSSFLDEDDQRQAVQISGSTVHREFSSKPGGVTIAILKQLDYGTITTMKTIKEMLADSSGSRCGHGRKKVSKAKSGFAAHENLAVKASGATSTFLKQLDNGTSSTMKTIKQMLADSSGSRCGHSRKIVSKAKSGFAARENLTVKASSSKKGGHYFPNSREDASAIATLAESRKQSIDDSIVPVGFPTSGTLKKPKSGPNMKSRKRTVTEASPSERGHGRRVVAKYRGERGK